MAKHKHSLLVVNIYNRCITPAFSRIFDDRRRLLALVGSRGRIVIESNRHRAVVTNLRGATVPVQPAGNSDWTSYVTFNFMSFAI